MNVAVLVCTILLSLTMFVASAHAAEISTAKDRMKEQMEAEQNFAQ